MLRSGFLVAALVATSAVTLTPRPAHADGRVKVPFSFTVEGKRCPAGTYEVKSDGTGNSVTLVGRDSSKIFSFVAVPGNNADDAKKVVLEFDQEGSDHALRSIQYGASATSRLDAPQRQSDDQDDTARGGR